MPAEDILETRAVMQLEEWILSQSQIVNPILGKTRLKGEFIPSSHLILLIMFDGYGLHAFW